MSTAQKKLKSGSNNEKWQLCMAHASKVRWEKYKKPFKILRGNQLIGIYQTQKECEQSKILSVPTVVLLLKKKLASAKGYTAEYINDQPISNKFPETSQSENK